MVFGILYRMIFWELFKVFALSLLGITGIMLIASIVAEASQQGLSLMQTLQIIPLLIPSTLPYTIPATMLFATCVVYGRLSHDNEILAIKSAGINILHVVKPALILGLAVSGATMGLYYRLIPQTHHLLRTMFLKEVEESLYGMLRTTRQINFPHLSYAIFAERVEGKKLINAIFKKRNAKGQPEVIIHAHEAEMAVNMHTRMVRVYMRDCEVYDMNPDGVRGCFPEKTEEVALPDTIGKVNDPKPRDLSWQQILKRRHEALAIEENLREEIKQADEHPERLKGTHLDVAKHRAKLDEKLYFTHQKVYQYDAELQMRPSLALGCFFFVVIGCPVGIWFSRSDFLSAFITCFLPIVFLYYPLMLCGTNLAKEGRFIPVLGVWGADILMAVIGLELFRRLLKN